MLASDAALHDTSDLMVYILFIIGFFTLIFGAEWLVEGSSKLAKKIGISELIVGLTIVAFGTSLPELIVSLFAINEGADSLAISNILGSNVANTLLVLGAVALIAPLTVHRAVVWREVIFGIFATIMLGVLVADKILGDSTGFVGLRHVDGLVLISYFIIFLYYTFRRTLTSKKPEKSTEEKAEISRIKVPFTLFQIVVGSIGLFLGGRWIVTGAVAIASNLGVSDALIGLTIVAVGTSLPELAASVSAIRKKKVDIAIGNVVGSNLFNILWVLGFSAVLSPLAFEPQQVFDVGIVIAVSIILLGTLVLGRYKHQISRSEGFIFLFLYALYVLFVVVRGIV